MGIRYFVVWAIFLSSSTLKAFDPSLDGLLHKAYVYQVQSMQEVNWLYVGFAPRMEDPTKIQVTFSKATYTMRVSLELSKKDLAEYPSYLVQKAVEMGEIINNDQLQIYQWWRLNDFMTEVSLIHERYDTGYTYSESQYRSGLALLKQKFPTNVFEYPDVSESSSPDDIVAVAHFVYPITINKGGKGWPRDGDYNQQARGFQSPQTAIQERRTEYGKRDAYGNRYVSSHIFSGFPAFWIDASGAGTGVHGPIRYSEPHENRRADSRCETYPRKMLDFWSQNHFREQDLQRSLMQDLPSVRYRWDLVRTNNSAGCFRAETMELRHLLPADTSTIWSQVKWTVTSNLDQFQVPRTQEWRYVDVNYYLLDHYSCPLTRKAWVEDRIIALNKGDQDPKTAEEFIEKSHLFEYLDPATIEFHLPGSFSSRASYQSMERLNKAGSYKEVENTASFEN